MQTIIITWGAGFIASHFLNTFALLHKEICFVNLDSVTYAGCLARIDEKVSMGKNYIFEKADIRDKESVQKIYEKYKPTDIIHFAAETHVDRSIHLPDIFLETNILGTNNLLELHREYNLSRFHYVSTDEVYGDNPGKNLSKEDDVFRPSSPYAASKAWAEMLVMAYGRTYGIDFVITRWSNTYGPSQYKEKLIPRSIDLLRNNKHIGLYGNGENIRDWIYVSDHCDAIWEVFRKWRKWSIYNIASGDSKTNKEVILSILAFFDKDESRISYITDRLGHDFRYAIDTSKIRHELAWEPKILWDKGIQKTLESDITFIWTF